MATTFRCWFAAMTGFETQRPAMSGYEKVSDLCPSQLDEENSLGYVSIKFVRREFQKIPVETPFSWSAWTFMWFQPIITLGQTKLIDKDDMLEDMVVEKVISMKKSKPAAVPQLGQIHSFVHCSLLIGDICFLHLKTIVCLKSHEGLWSEWHSVYC